MNIKVEYIAGISGDRVKVTVFDEGKLIRTEEYCYGYNASYNRRFAKYAEDDVEKAKKYNWKYGYRYHLKPYIGDLLTNLFTEYGLTKDDVEYSGRYVFAEREATPEEVEEMKKGLYAEL